MAHVEHALVLDDLAVGQGERAAGDHEPEAGPVGRGDRLAEGRVAGPVAVDAGDEGRRRGDGGALFKGSARPGLAVRDREPRLDLALAERVEALDLEPPVGVGGRLGEAALRDDLARRQLVVQDVEERDRAAAGVQHPRRHPVGLGADADERRPAQLGDQHRGIGALTVATAPNVSPSTRRSCGRRRRPVMSARVIARIESLLPVRPMSMCRMSLVTTACARPAA